ncbi:hypothetical protein CMV_007898 [Castanea mollissima]|uniref:Uncharacterized protein n=1 Tax=Castanea mollissima TaxID=60419 RepID=A0A8J4VZY6_9ROSI|nr:hypothetical protein CMV_007898 [Castanea mollissima]
MRLKPCGRTQIDIETRWQKLRSASTKNPKTHIGETKPDQRAGLWERRAESESNEDSVTQTMTMATIGYMAPAHTLTSRPTLTRSQSHPRLKLSPPAQALSPPACSVTSVLLFLLLIKWYEESRDIIVKYPHLPIKDVGGMIE